MTKVSILGINGHLGQHLAAKFQHAGFAVTGFGRSNRHKIAGINFVKGDASDPVALKAVIADADIVVNALNLPYDKWDNGRAEAQLATVIAAMGDSGKTLMFPGNIYNYAATDHRIAPSTPQHPQTSRGEIRMRQEQMLEAASRAGRFQTLIIRAGDFFGPDNSGDWFDQAIMTGVDKGKLHHMADLDLHHAWAYLPDLPRAFVAVATQRKGLSSFENFHFAGHYATHGQLMAAIQKAAPEPMVLKPVNWLLLQAIGLAVPILREVVKMRYLWTHEMELVDPRLEAILGPDFGTPFEAAVAATTRRFFPAHRAAA